MIFNYLFKHFSSFCFSIYLLYYEPIALWFVMIGLPIVTELQAEIVLDKFLHLGSMPSQYELCFRKDYVKLGIALENWYGGNFL